MCTSRNNQFGADPANVNWTVVRGDTSILQVQFYEPDEITPLNTTGWNYASTVYDPNGAEIDTLNVVGEAGLVTVTAPADTTINWGAGYKTVVSELQFDVQVTIPSEDPDVESIVWTPVIGYISVLGDVSSGGLY
jgi:hypothetical protein